MNQEKPEDGRKYHVGDKVNFTDDEGKIVPGVVHGVSYKEDPKTGERYDFSYIMVHEHEHKAWHEVEGRNTARMKKHQENIKKFRGSVDPKDPDHAKNFKDMPMIEAFEQHPPLKQHIRIFEEDKA